MKFHLSRIAILNLFRKFKYVFLALILFILCFIVFQHFRKDTLENYRQSNRKDHLLCIIVPFRDRFEELLEFAPYLSNFLGRQNVEHRIFVVNQLDQYRFNRGSLINVGFRFIAGNVSNCDYIAMHDVDLLPLNEKISYSYPGNDVFHVSSPTLHPKYHYQKFVGGILLISKRQFARVNGLSNKYWGWGMEDDEFYLRLKEKKITINRPGNVGTNYTNSFKHIHGPKRVRDMQRCYDQAKINLQRDRRSGLNNVQYTILAIHSLKIDGFGVTLLNVQLKCDRQVTPWCLCESIEPI